jgi:ParB-like chromosome segregation protein Spo0J
MEAHLPKLRKRGPAPPPLVWKAHAIEQRQISSLKPYVNNVRRHDEKNIQGMKDFIITFGLVLPILIEQDGTIIAGHACILAADAAGLQTVPCVVIDHPFLSPMASGAAFTR